MEQTLALIERSHKGDKDARNVLAQQNMGLVYTSRGVLMAEDVRWKI